MADVDETSEEGFLISRSALNEIVRGDTYPTGPTKPVRSGAGSVGRTSPEPFEGMRPFVIAAWEEATEDQQFEYEVSPVINGGTAWDGMAKMAITFPARNRWEKDADNAKYENASVDGVLPIPIGSPVDGYWSFADGQARIIFTERNEPKCES